MFVCHLNNSKSSKRIVFKLSELVGHGSRNNRLDIGNPQTYNCLDICKLSITHAHASKHTHTPTAQALRKTKLQFVPNQDSQDVRPPLCLGYIPAKNITSDDKPNYLFRLGLRGYYRNSPSGVGTLRLN